MDTAKQGRLQAAPLYGEGSPDTLRRRTPAMDRRRFLNASALLALPAAQRAFAMQQPDPAKPALPASILSLRSRAAEAVPITLAEREQRVERARTLLRQNKISALLMAGGTSLAYFTGLHWYNSERLLAWVLPANGAAFIVCPAFEEARAREQLSTMPGGSTTRVYIWQEDESPYGLGHKALSESSLATGRLGLEERTPFIFASELGKACPAMQIVDGTPVTAGCRMIKSAAELALMRLACSATLQVYEAAWKAGHPGMTTHAFSELVSAGYERVGFPGEASCQTGVYSALPHGSSKPQIIREGEIVLIDDGCVVEGYQSDLSRTFVYGKPPDKMLRIFDVIHRAQTAAAAAARPGLECQTVDAAARGIITAAGLGPDYRTFSHRVGHGIGMDGHEWPYLVRGNTTKLQEGMTFSDEPGVYLPGEFGIRLEDDMAIAADGGKLMTPQSKSLTEPFA